MFTIASASNLLTPMPRSELSNYYHISNDSKSHGGIKAYCTGNPHNLRTQPVLGMLEGTLRIRPIDYIEPGKKYWGKSTKTCAVFVDGDSALVPHEREELLSILAGYDDKGKMLNGVDFLIGTVYINFGERVLEFPMKKYRNIWLSNKYITLKPVPYYYDKDEEKRYSVASTRLKIRFLKRVLSREIYNVLIN